MRLAQWPRIVVVGDVVGGGGVVVVISRVVGVVVSGTCDGTEQTKGVLIEMAKIIELVESILIGSELISVR